jgi:hypothetical protein
LHGGDSTSSSDEEDDDDEDEDAEPRGFGEPPLQLHSELEN